MATKMLPPRLSAELEALKGRYRIEVVEDGDMINLIVADFPTSELYSPASTTLLLRVPKAYPDAGPDMFWTDVELQLADGSTPNAGESIEPYVGRRWRRFSWHHRGWNPALSNLATYLEFVRRRFHAR